MTASPHVAESLDFLRDATAHLLAITAKAVVDRPERVTVSEASELNTLSNEIEQAFRQLERALSV